MCDTVEMLAQTRERRMSTEAAKTWCWITDEVLLPVVHIQKLQHPWAGCSTQVTKSATGPA